ncbi:neutrophil cytosol factor 2-like [Acipenser ruthenus]|uniref:neutrophil cytosol factor 2-like n=1 Tax=Acipenser ruthenus TaxID=7906 RepID=UPI0027406E14|nr:neutrophil cytosol factor 2-like [Acipenser ruthenus]
MLYTDLIREWHAAVQAVDEKDWVSALGLLENISEPTSKIFFTAASVHLVLGQLEQAIKALDRTIAKDERLAVGFFQRGAVHMLAGRLEEALSDCSLALKHFRGNSVIDYRQLGLHYKLHSWQVLYNAAAVHTRLGQWDKSMDFLEKAAGLTGEGRGVSVEQAVVQVKSRMLLEPLMVPKGEVFRPRKQDVEQLIQRDFLGKPKVISSIIPDDDFAGFEPLRPQRPGFYEPKVDGLEASRYCRVCSSLTPQDSSELEVQEGEVVFVLDSGKDGWAVVIHDGKKCLFPTSRLEPVDVNKTKKEKASSFPNGIPLPPDLKPPTRPQSRVNLELPKLGSRRSSLADSSVQTPLSSERRPSLPGTTHQSHPVSPFKSELPAGGGAAEDSAQDSVIVKVHYTYTVAMRVSPEISYCQLQARIREKLQQQQAPGHLQLRCRDSGSQALKPITGDTELRALWERAEGGRTTVWCQYEDPLAGRPILYQVVALYDYESQGPEDLEFSKGDTIDILSEVNDEWLEGHTAGNIGIFPRCFIYQDTDVPSSIPKSMPT